MVSVLYPFCMFPIFVWQYVGTKGAHAITCTQNTLQSNNVKSQAEVYRLIAANMVECVVIHPPPAPPSVQDLTVHGGGEDLL